MLGFKSLETFLLSAELYSSHANDIIFLIFVAYLSWMARYFALS